MSLSRKTQVKQEEQSWLSTISDAMPFEFSAPSVENFLNNSKTLVGGAVFLAQFTGTQAAQCLTQDGKPYLLHCDWIQNLAYHRTAGLSAGLHKTCGTVLANMTDCGKMINTTHCDFGSDAYYNMPLCSVTHSSDVLLSPCMTDYLKANTPNKETVTCPDLGTLALAGTVVAAAASLATYGLFKLAQRAEKKDPELQSLLGVTIQTDDGEQLQTEAQTEATQSDGYEAPRNKF